MQEGTSLLPISRGRMAIPGTLLRKVAILLLLRCLSLLLWLCWGLGLLELPVSFADECSASASPYGCFNSCSRTGRRAVLKDLRVVSLRRDGWFLFRRGETFLSDCMQ